MIQEACILHTERLENSGADGCFWLETKHSSAIISCMLLGKGRTFDKILHICQLSWGEIKNEKGNIQGFSVTLLLDSLSNPSYAVLPKQVVFNTGKSNHTNRFLLQTAVIESTHCVLNAEYRIYQVAFQFCFSFLSHCNPWVWINTTFSYVNPSLPKEDDPRVSQYSRITR